MGSDKYNFREEIVDQIEKSAALKDDVISKHVDIINAIANKIINAYSNNNKVIWFGNGGSAADAQHLSCELVSKFLLDREAIPSIALTTNTSILTAISNDYRYEDVFKRQVEALAQKGDILIGITTSGTSPNVLKALEVGKKKGTVNIAFTGKRTAEIKELVDYLIDIPSKETPRIQESHIMVGHIVCDLVERTLFGDQKWETKQPLLTETEL